MTGLRLKPALLMLGCLGGMPARAALPAGPAARPEATPAVPDAAPDTASRDAAVGWLAWAREDLEGIRESLARAGWEAAIALGLNTERLPEPPVAADVAGAAPGADDATDGEPAAGEPPVAAPPPMAAAPPQATPRPARPAIPAAPVIPASVEARAGDADPGLLTHMVFDQAARLPTGAYFVPKPTQRLFGVRTLRVSASDVRPTVRLPGRIVPDPHAHGDVEASLLGRIEAGPNSMPVLGTRVTRGEVLGYVTPAIGVVDRTQVRREVARLTNEIRLETEAMERLGQFWFVPFRDGKLIQARMKIEGLRRERDALLPMLQIREVLRASIDGVVSRSTAVLGRIAHPGEMIFEIVDPHALWVEATAQDPQVAEVAQQAAEATATTPEGEMLHLTFVGSGLTLEQQAVPLLLRIDDPTPSLRVDRPVTVTMHTNAMMRHGIVVPRAALVVGNDGVSEVWAQTGPEEFAPYRVLSEEIDGASVLIIGGLPDGQRVVVQGLKLLTALN